MTEAGAGEPLSRGRPPSGRLSRGRPPPPLLFAGLAVGFYAVVAGLLPAGLGTRSTEVADQIVPGLVVLAVVYVAIRWEGAAATLAPWLVLLSGAWMALADVGLVRLGWDHHQRWAVVYHASTTAAVLVLAGVWLRRFRDPLPVDDGI